MYAARLSLLAVGDNVTELAAGDYVVISVRRPGTSIYDQIGAEDMTTDDVYYERGISHLHGFLTEYVVDDAKYMVRLPASFIKVFCEVAVDVSPLERVATPAAAMLR